MSDKAELLEPKVFISYNWTDEAHKERVREWADRLMGDGVHVILDVYDLEHGHDKYKFMEKMVEDPTITHVLLICDKEYVEKANERRAGVGTEALIVSQEVYKKAAQSKFVPVFCEYNEGNEPYLPIFIATRIGFNFTSPEQVNSEWENLIRFLHGKPRFTKPALGKKPAYLTEETAVPTSGIAAKYRALKHGLIEGKHSSELLRDDFFDACIEYAEDMRIYDDPDVDDWGERIISDYEKLKPVRNFLVDWLMLEGKLKVHDVAFSETVINILERVRALKSRPEEVTRWSEVWYAAHALFVYEVFLYSIAALIKTNNFQCAASIFDAHFVPPETDQRSGREFERFDTFFKGSDWDNILNKALGSNYYSPEAELIKRHADRKDLSFKDVMQADLVVFVSAKFRPDLWWYPQTLYYAERYRAFDLFIRATQRSYFDKISVMFGTASIDDFKTRLSETDLLDLNKWHRLSLSFERTLNIEKLASS
ncbi:SEFIR domain protein [Pseudovibrio sp. FO-BEG1]|uniref:toll/interleukin-1 receptor domain-containing protein n=1 Tax=Pseudovibrio sp. (strain FO-BEG1) TaxID=911045 RepID=UPI000238C9F0|nr:toll/interleukin-1 receptor domain-containing protein [Pseudovibrio sp. FO-BEG1]AEV36802.1 SEFIR domain protein [Pseudovibrio sp. FO-BEG1]